MVQASTRTSHCASTALFKRVLFFEFRLAEVVAAWPTLPEITQQAILNLVHERGGTCKSLDKSTN
jgi:hypothetical protein